MEKGSVWIYLAAMLIAAVSQILLKKSAVRSYPNRWREYANPYVLAAYGMFTVSMFIALYAYRYLPISLAAILESTAILFVVILGRVFLGEKIRPRKLIGLIGVAAGIAVTTLGSGM